MKKLGIEAASDAALTAAKVKRNQLSLVAATSHQLCKQAFDGVFDYLFVDEATQVSLPNLLAMGSCAENIVLLGDQMQLEQPTQGTHPGETGRSALGYLSNESPTFEEYKGVFFPVTRRMHPAVCDFISVSFYESRLQPFPGLEKRVLTLPKSSLKYLKKPAGVYYVAVNHEANVLESEEEVSCIVELTHELLQCQWTDNEGVTRNMTQKDILYVAPYNLQVARLKEALPKEARVGSVDLFQGQEAPVVIYSMCASDGESAPRGLEFLLNPNRVNVAISRAMSLAIVVGSPRLAETNCKTIEAMRLLNTYCRIISYSGAQKGVSDAK